LSLRVAVVHSFYSSGQPSGENVQVEAEVDLLVTEGVDARLFAIRTDDAQRERLHALRAAARVATGVGQSPLAAIADFGADVVHVHNLFPNFGRAWVRQLHVPLVATLHNFRFTCANGLLFRDGRVCTDCVAQRPWPGLRHRCYRGSAVATLPLTIANWRGPAVDPVLSSAARILCPSSRQRLVLEAAGLGDRVVEWPHFLPDHLDPGGLDSAGRDGVVCAARLTPEKGVVELVRGWSGDVVLRVAGDGPLRAETERAARGRNVELVGALARPELLALMAASAALAVPGTVPETGPLTYVEALACGLPVIARRGSDMGERVIADATGCVVAAPAEMPAAAELLADDDAVRARCRRVFAERYSAETYARRALDLYRSLTEPGHRRDRATRATL
jgi:glycosyltransferase involved in cell wall biosynthesis